MSRGQGGWEDVLSEPREHFSRHQWAIPLGLEDLDPIFEPVAQDVSVRVLDRLVVDVGGEESPVGTLTRGQ